jgi:hypothetical protein
VKAVLQQLTAMNPNPTIGLAEAAEMLCKHLGVALVRCVQPVHSCRRTMWPCAALRLVLVRLQFNSTTSTSGFTNGLISSRCSSKRKSQNV